MTLLLLAGPTLTGLAACDRQSPPSGQANAGASDEVAPTSGEVKGGGEAAHSFDYKLDRSKAGTALPAHAFRDPSGRMMTFSDFAGKPMLVNLWATWCAPCVAEMPTLDALAERLGPKGLAVLTISQDTQGDAAVAPFFKKHALPHLTAYTDAENKLGFAYETTMLPTTILYDRQGKETVRVIGSMDWNGPEARKLIDEAMTR